MSILMPMDYIEVTGEFGNSPGFYAQFGQRGHNGLDLGTKRAPGMNVYATDAGEVVYEGWGSGDSWMGSIAGICVRLRHWWGYSAYAHLQNTIVNRGQWLARGQKLGESGATGVGTGYHLHFETFPPNPNFANGYAGRVNPRVFGLVPRSSTPSKPTPPPIKKEPLVMKTYTPEKGKEQVIKPGDYVAVHISKEKYISLDQSTGDKLVYAQINLTGTKGDFVEMAISIDDVNSKDDKTTRKRFQGGATDTIEGSKSTKIGATIPMTVGGKARDKRIRVYLKNMGKNPVKVQFVRWAIGKQ